ncbi:MAG: GNAT family N-acetyltransferase [Clostridiales bacterium]|nr:GNAT family N-acetyltransferase [Clostridiales bacterium]
MEGLFDITWVNIFYVIIGGLTAIVTICAKKAYVDMKLERKFSVSGRYITKFQESKYKDVIITTSAELKQNGKRIYGTTKMPGDSRKWILEGQLSEDGHIHGIYYAEDPIDKRTGVFFLKIHSKKHMTGVKSSLDTEKQEVTSGTYEFKPICNNVTIKKLVKSHIPHIISIADNLLGKDHLTQEILEKITNGSPDFYCDVAIDSQNKVVGFYIGYITHPKIIEEKMKINQDEIPRSIKYANKIGVIKTVVVEEKHQGYGIGTKLVESCMKELKKAGVQMICSIASKNRNFNNMDGIFKNLGFNIIAEVPEYWSDESIEKGYRCPICKEPPCECSAVIYNLTI